MEQLKIYDLVRKMEDDDNIGNTTISKYVEFSMRETLDKVDAYINSKHTTGDIDSMEREKPFFNIVVAARNIWFRATDIDRSNILLKATKAGHYVLAFLANILLQEWMKKLNFGAFLNEWGRSLATYGSTILKFVEKDGDLHCHVMPWSVMIVDPIDFENNPKIEKIWMTPAQLRKQKGYNKEMVKGLLDSLGVRETATGEKKDNKSGYIPIYEIHGEMPLSYLTGEDDDDDTYVQQMHVISFLKSKETGKFDDYTLYSGKEAKDPYMITHLIKEDGRTLAVGSVEHLFEAQWMQNHTAKQIKDQLDLASKIIFQTSDGNFVGQNVLTSIENGDILLHANNEPLTMLNNKPDIGAMQSYSSQWKSLGNEIVGVSEAMLGAAPKAGTAWRQTEATLQENHSLFELMTENKGLHLEDMMRKFIIPFVKKQMDTTEEISAILEDHQITQLDSIFVPNEVIKRVNEKIKKTILSGKLFTANEQDEETQKETVAIQESLKTLGNQRFIKPSDVPTKTWKDILKDFEWKLEVDVTGEAKNTQAIMQTLTTVLQTLSTNPQVLEDPRAKLVFNRIINEVGGLSPVELSQANSQVKNQLQQTQLPQTSQQLPSQMTPAMVK